MAFFHLVELTYHKMCRLLSLTYNSEYEKKEFQKYDRN